MTPYKLKLLQSLSGQDKTTRRDFCTEMQERCEEDGFSESLIFSDESTFHISGKVNKENVHIWGTENLRATVQHVRDSPKVNVFCAMSCKIVRPLLFPRKTVTGASYLDMLINWLMSELHREARNYLDANLPQRWTRRATGDMSLTCWPPRSHDLTPCDFFYGVCQR
jgi:hypothetical protein